MSAVAEVDHRFRLTDAEARSLADQFGTPLYVIDESHFRNRIGEYVRASLAADPRAEVTYASKANSTLALLRIAAQEGATIDVASEGELRAALAAGVPASKCHSHGNNKSEGEIAFALSSGVSHIVVDNFEEIETIALVRAGFPESTTQFVLRLAPGVDPITNAKISTGQADTKFGFNITDGSAEKATRRCLKLGLPLIGYHCHVGSQLLDPEAQRAGGELIARLAVDMCNATGFIANYFNVGGGLGVHYTEADRPMVLSDYCRLVTEAVCAAVRGTPLDSEHLRIAQEPGRSLVAESGVTLYTVGVVKKVPAKEKGSRTYVAVDGGLADNPRPALYGSKHTVIPVSHDGREFEHAAEHTVSGRHCETDRLFVDVPLPLNIRKGDLLQVLVTGAYNASMASNYNRYPRPAMALRRLNGTFSLIASRDTWVEMFARESVPENL